MATLVENLFMLAEDDAENPELSTLHILNLTGDSRIQWDHNDPVQVAAARKKFEEMTAKGYTAHRVDASGAMGAEMKDYDPTAGRVRFVSFRHNVGG